MFQIFFENIQLKTACQEECVCMCVIEIIQTIYKSVCYEGSMVIKYDIEVKPTVTEDGAEWIPRWKET